MRLFLAIYPPKEYLDFMRDTLRKFAKEKRNLKYTPVDQMHLTIKFIGPRVTEESKDWIIEEFKKRQHELAPVKLELTGVRLGFKMQNMKQRRILMAKFKQTDSFEELVKSSYKIVRELKFSDTIYWKQKYTINNHVTIARIKSTATKKNGKEVMKISDEIAIPKLKPVYVNEMYFVESLIQPDFSPVYKKLEKLELKGEIPLE